MATAAQTQTTPTTTDPIENWLARRAATSHANATPTPTPQSLIPESRTRANRANAKLSTGPRTEPGKQRSSLNALRHGLTAQTAVLPTEDPETYQRHIQQFLDEYAPATPTETQLVHEIANTAWRLNRIPLLESELFSQNPNPQTQIPMLATLGLHSSRLSRQFQKALDQLRDIQEERHRLERRQLTEAAQLFLRHQHKGLPWDPADLSFGTTWLRFFKRTNRAPRTKADASEPGLLRPPPRAHCQVLWRKRRLKSNVEPSRRDRLGAVAQRAE
jgi:AraC-like DNA-binding protein